MKSENNLEELDMNFSEWRKIELGELIDSISIKHKFDKNQLIFLNTSDVLEGKVLHQNYSDINTLPGQAKKSIKKGDILFSEIRPKNKRFALVDFDADDYVVSTKLMVLRRKNSLIDNLFLYKYLTSDRILEELQFIAEGRSGTFPQITFNELKSLKISLPLLNEQKAIVDILSSLDDKIELNNQMNKTLEEMAQALFKRWFVDFEFPNEEGQPYKSSGGEMVESELGMIPEKWQPGKLGDLIYVQNGYAFKSKDLSEEGEVGIIKIKNISDNTVDIINKQYICEDLVSNIHPKFKVYGTNLLIAMTGAEVGKIGLVPLNKQELYLNQRVGCIKEVIQGGEIYAYNYLLRAEAQEMIRAKAIGSAQPNISTSGIEELKIITPSKDILKAFEIIGGNLLYNMCRLREENNLLIQLRDTLLPKLMSGEIRVSDLEG